MAAQWTWPVGATEVCGQPPWCAWEPLLGGESAAGWAQQRGTVGCLFRLFSFVRILLNEEKLL